ncbi:MAG TPA: heme o synthase [Minicystis sp.]|nr:heme o synthase [Minicystis sp.]
MTLDARAGLIDEGAPPVAAAPSRARRGALGVAADVVALGKPRITAMVIVTQLGGIALAVHARGAAPRALTLALAVVGTALVVAGANTLNMYLERDSDRLMERTRDRPLPAGRLAPEVALGVGLLAAVVSVPLLTFAVNATTGLVAALALVSYVLAYTPLKRRTTAALLIGAVPGAAPPLIGWTSVTGRVELPGLLLFAVLFFWQIPHFLAIATFRRDEYARAGLKVLPVERGDAVTRRHVVAHLALLVTASLALVPAGVGGRVYLVAATVLGAALFGIGAAGLAPGAGVRWARGLFLSTLVYLTLLFAALVVSP